MARNNSAQDVAKIQREIAQMMGDVEKRLDKLNSLARNGASHARDDISDYVSDTATALRGRAREMGDMVSDRARDMSNQVAHSARHYSGEAAQMGNDAYKRLASEIDQRPLLTIAIAAGIGFLAGLSARSSSSSS